MGRTSDKIMGIMRQHRPCLLGNLVEKGKPASLIHRCECSSTIRSIVACCVTTTSAENCM